MLLIDAGNQLLIAANSTYDYESSVWESMTHSVRGTVQNKILETIGADAFNADLAFVGASSKATVTIGNDAILKARGSDTYKPETEDDPTSAMVIDKRAITIQANSTNVLEGDTPYASTGFEKGKYKGFLGLGALYQYNENEAKIVIGEGAKLTADKQAVTADEYAGGIGISTSVSTSSTGSVEVETDPEKQQVAKGGFGILIASGDTNNDIIINKNAELTAQSDVEIGAETEFKTNFSVSLKDNDSTYLNTALIYSDMNSNANIKINDTVISQDG